MQNEIEIMRVLRVPPMGKLVVEVKGNRYEAISELQNPKNRQLLLAAVGELITFAGGYQELIDAGVAAPTLPPQTQKSLEEQRAEFLTSIETSQQPTTVNRPAKRKVTAVNEPKEVPVVEQIDAILQKQLASHPSLSQHRVQLIGDPNGGIKIDVDGKIYGRPKEIENKEIQLVIKQALKEWEST